MHATNRSLFYSVLVLILCVHAWLSIRVALFKLSLARHGQLAGTRSTASVSMAVVKAVQCEDERLKLTVDCTLQEVMNDPTVAADGGNPAHCLRA